jgi:hypothetical protein
VTERFDCRADVQYQRRLGPLFVSAFVSVCGCAGPRSRPSGEEWQCPDLIESPGERDGPGPSLGEAQDSGAAAIHEATGEGEDPGAHAAGHCELIVGMDGAETRAPTNEVVGKHGAGEPGAVGEEVPRGAVLEASPLFEITDGQLDAGMGAVEGVDGHGVELDVG